jgi:hypothetical protein
MSPAEDWGFLAQQTVEKLIKALLVLHGQEPPRSHSLQRLLQELAACGDTPAVAPFLLDLDDFAVLARTDAEPTPLPGVAPGQPALRGAVGSAGGPTGCPRNAAATLPGASRWARWVHPEEGGVDRTAAGGRWTGHGRVRAADARGHANANPCDINKSRAGVSTCPAGSVGGAAAADCKASGGGIARCLARGSCKRHR